MTQGCIEFERGDGADVADRAVLIGSAWLAHMVVSN
jgi:hypothetical protein